MAAGHGLPIGLAMKELPLILSFSLLFGAMLAPCTSVVQGQPAPLDDHALQKVAAGRVDTGGVLVAGSSSARLELGNRLILEQQVQAEARSLNLVNSSSSGVAAGANIWHGSPVSTSGQLSQVNTIDQQESPGSVLQGYDRPQGEWHQLASQSQHNSSSRSLDSSRQQSNLVEQQSSNHDQSNSTVNTRQKFSVGDPENGVVQVEANTGQGVALAGQLQTVFAGGSAQFGLTAGAGLSVGADIGGSPAEPLMIGGINLGQTGASAGIQLDAMLSLLATIELPTLELDLQGGGCGVVMGSCSSQGSSEQYDRHFSDTSLLQSHDERSQTTSSVSSSDELQYRAPLQVEEAQGDYIVVDHASLELISDQELELSDSAQRKVRGMNVVNAVGSVVTHGINIAYGDSLAGSGELFLRQSNSLRHAR